MNTEFQSINPCEGSVVWTGSVSGAAMIDVAVVEARAAWPAWRRTPVAEREAILIRYAEVLARRASEIERAIKLEVGKPRREAAAEVRSMIGKVNLSIEARRERAGGFSRGGALTRFKPHGVLAVLGPFNFPGHLPNGHIVPALLAGNAVVFKPSELAPWTGSLLVEALREAGLPAGVAGLVQGGRAQGEALAAHPGVDGVLFTGGARAGIALHAAFAGRPEKVLALELGGNNPLVVDAVGEVAAAARLVVESAFATAGQRCTCARRLILPEGAEGDAVLEAVVAGTGALTVGAPDEDPEPFMGPVISVAAARQLLMAADHLRARGARELVPLAEARPGTALLSAGIYDVTGMADRGDEELFGPVLQVVRVRDFDDAIREANRTAFGLAAGLVSDDPVRHERFLDEVRAGVVNWNRLLPGASGSAPFGGVGRSGNFRPSAWFAADYCAYPVASLEAPTVGGSPS
jgi:succinylglutamic semialdehyde dehydrogenase